MFAKRFFKIYFILVISLHIDKYKTRIDLILKKFASIISIIILLFEIF